MPKRGRFVRRIVDSASEDDDTANIQGNTAAEMNCSDASLIDDDDNSDMDDHNTKESTCSSSLSANSPDPPSFTDTTNQESSNPTTSERANSERIDRMEQMITNIQNALTRFDTGPPRNDDADTSWKLSTDTEHRGNNESCSNIRWDHLKPFPSGVAANRMWEEWNRYVEKFEIAVSISNVMDPVKRTQLLFLSIGDEMQGIVKAAKLRPSLSSSSCYRTFVTNVQQYLRSMTDTAAEHEAFSRMVQENGESAVSFHARLMGKVRSCHYSVDDEDRFVRAQLMTGLKNRELVKQARAYAYDTNFIVQSAARMEAFESENTQRSESSVLEVRSGYKRPSFEHSQQTNNSARDMKPPTKQRRYDDTNRRSQQRSRCTRCCLSHHRNGQCPALTRTCNKCGRRGHYAAACRQRQVNTLQNKIKADKYQDGSDSEDRVDAKQVLID